MRHVKDSLSATVENLPATVGDGHVGDAEQHLVICVLPVDRGSPVYARRIGVPCLGQLNHVLRCFRAVIKAEIDEFPGRFVSAARYAE